MLNQGIFYTFIHKFYVYIYIYYFYPKGNVTSQHVRVGQRDFKLRLFASQFKKKVAKFL